METPNPAPPVDIQAIESAFRTKELARINQLEAMGKQYARFGGEELARKAIGEGGSVADLQASILERVKATPPPSADIGLTEREVQQFSFMRAINALAHPGDLRAREAAKFEFEVGEAAAKATGRQAQGILVPNEVLKAGRRDLSVGTTTAGGHTVATNLLAESFIDLLRNRIIVAQAGATMLTGLTGNVAIPVRPAARRRTGSRRRARRPRASRRSTR